MGIFAGSNLHKNKTLSELTNKILPPLLLGQIAVGHKKEIQPDLGFFANLNMPCALILWARISDELDKKFIHSTYIPTLKPEDWNSGDNYWIIDTAGPKNEIIKLMKELQKQRFKSQSFKSFAVDKNNKISIHKLD